MTYRVKGGWINTRGSHWAVQKEEGREGDTQICPHREKEKDNYMQRMTGGEREREEMKNRTRSEPADSSF